MPLLLNSRAPGGRGHHPTSNELPKAGRPSLPGPSDQGQSGDGTIWKQRPGPGLRAGRGRRRRGGPGQPRFSESRCAPLPPGASGPPSLQTLACICFVLRPTSSFLPDLLGGVWNVAAAACSAELLLSP